MAKYYALPSIYLGSHSDGEALYRDVQTTYQENKSRFSSANLFLRHLLSYALENDKTLRKTPSNPQ